MKTKFYLVSFLLSFVFTSYSQTTPNKESSQSKTQAVQMVPEKTIKVKGFVVDSLTQKPLQMAYVLGVGVNTGTVTDLKGYFIIEMPIGAKQLSFSAKGYKEKKGKIDDKKEMKIELVPKVN